jgi:large subunit ribosomal protein L35
VATGVLTRNSIELKSRARSSHLTGARQPIGIPAGSKETSQMPKIKMKTKSGVKKRYKLTATGKVVATQANKRHGMIKRTNKQIRQQRRTTILNPSDAKIVKSWMPYG